jgi:hypothetical protein
MQEKERLMGAMMRTYYEGGKKSKEGLIEAVKISI